MKCSKIPGRWLRWLWTQKNTVDQHQQMNWQPKSSLTVETSHWTSSNMDSGLSTLPQTLRPDFQMKCKILLSSERGLWTLSNSPVLFLHSPGIRRFWRCLWFRRGLVSPFSWKTSERGESWCTDSSFSPLLVKLSSQVCESALLYCILKLAVIPVAGAPFLPKFFLTVTLHLICFDTALCKQPHLSVITFCDLPSLWRVSMFVFWIIAKSAVFSIIVVSKNKRYPEFILYGWSFIETQM